jgi:phosphoribosylanthranilate isomerase
MALEIKICGLRSHEAVSAAVQAGADMVGFVFFARSPRNVTIAAAAELGRAARGRAGIVALVVDADDRLLTQIVEGLRPDLLQLHGSETPARAGDIRRQFGVPVMKALQIASASDLAPLQAFAPHVDRFLFDAKAPPTLANALPGGNGISFDWRLVAGLDPGRPSMLSGGLDTANVADAIRLTGLRGIDVSSGVERRPGEKDPEMIKAFIAAARAAL